MRPDSSFCRARRPVPVAAAALGTVLTAGAALMISFAPSTADVHRVAYVVPADIADGSGSDGSGGCPPGAACMRPPGVPLTAGGSSVSTGSGSSGSNSAAPLPVPGSDPDEIASHHAKFGEGGSGADTSNTPPASVAPAGTPPDDGQTILPLTTPAGTSPGGNATTGGSTASGGTTASGGAGGGENLSPNQAMDLVATILGAVSKLIAGLLG